MAFKTAAGLAYKELVNASPVILEPIGTLTVTMPKTEPKQKIAVFFGIVCRMAMP